MKGKYITFNVTTSRQVSSLRSVFGISQTKDWIDSLNYLHISSNFFGIFGTHVIFPEIDIMQISFLYKKVFVHIKDSFQHIQKLAYLLTFAVLMRLGN